MGVLDVGDGYCGVVDPIIDHSVDRYRHRILGQNLAHRYRNLCNTAANEGEEDRSATAGLQRSFYVDFSHFQFHIE